MFSKCFFKARSTRLCLTIAAAVGCGPIAAMETHQIVVNGREWQTTRVDFGPDSDIMGVKFHLTKPDDVVYQSHQEIGVSIIGACNVILKNRETMLQDVSSVDGPDHIFFEVTSGEGRAWPYALRVAVDGGNCTSRFSFVMSALDDPFSKHLPSDEALSVFHTWGLGAPEIAFETGSSGKTLAVEFAVAEGFERNLAEVPALAFCIHSIANLERTVAVGPLTFDVANYTKIEVEIVQRSSGFFSTSTSVIGRAVFGQKDGLCVPYEGQD